MRSLNSCFKFTLACIVTMAVAIAAWVGFVNWVGRGFAVEQFVPRFLAVKRYIAQNTQGRRLFVFSGSNAQYAVDSDELSRALGVEVVNMACWIAIPPRFYIAELDRILKKDDVVYLPLEPDLYHRQEDYYYSTTCLSFYWGIWPEVQKCLSWKQLATLYLSKSLGWVELTLPKRGEAAVRQNREISPQKAYEEVVAGQKYNTSFGLTTRGDIRCSLLTSMSVSDGVTYEPGFSDDFLDSIKEIKRIVEDRGARLFIGYMTCYSYSENVRLQEFMQEQKSLGIPIVGRVEALAFPYGYYWNEPRHLNKIGMRFYTEELINEFSPVFGRTQGVRESALTVFARTPEAVEAKEKCTYETGCRVSGPAFLVVVRQPVKIRGHGVVGEFVLDRQGDSGAMIETVMVGETPVKFEETVYGAKNTLRVFWRQNAEAVVLHVKLRADRHVVGLERLLLDGCEDDEISKLRTFNDVSPAFEADKANALRFRWIGGEHEPYLRFSVPEWRSNRYRVTFSVRAPRAALALLRVRGAMYSKPIEETPLCSIGEDGIARIVVCIQEGDYFVYKDGRLYVGLSFPPDVLNKDDVVELVDFKFELL